MINPNVAIGAYTNTSNIAAGQGSKVTDTDTESGDGGGVSFSALLEKSVTQSIDTLKAGEEMSAKAVVGEANMTDVVQAVTAAEVTLQTAVALRDRMVSAYQDIMRMPI